MFISDYVLNGTGHGEVGRMMEQVRFEPGLMRPYLVTVNGRNIPCVTINALNGEQKFNPKTKTFEPVRKQYALEQLAARNIYSPVANATSLRKEEWLLLDQKLILAARYRLQAWADLAKRNPFGGFNGMSKTILERETVNDPGEAFVDMDALSETRGDSPKYQLEGLPLPITHGGFRFSSRRLAESRNSGTPLDLSLGEATSRRCAETVEKTTIGIQTGITYGGNSTQVGGYGRTSSVYGYTNFSSRLTRTGLYKPTGNGRSGTGWVPADTLKDVLACLDQLKAQKFYGPWMLYHSNDWDQYMDNDYILTGGNVATQTLRERLKAIKGIEDVVRLDMLFSSTPSSSTGPGGENLATTYPFVLLFVQMTPDVAQAVTGMDMTTIQWENKGGLELNFKVMCIMVPRLGADYYGNCGILHATADHA